MYELTSGIVSATKTLLALSVSSGGYVFRTRYLQAVNEEAVANSKALVKISHQPRAQVCGPSNTPCHGSTFPGPRKLGSYSLESSPSIIIV